MTRRQHIPLTPMPTPTVTPATTLPATPDSTPDVTPTPSSTPSPTLTPMPANPVKNSSNMSDHRKGKALLIALLNLNLIFLVTVIAKTDVQIASQMITAVLFLVGIYVGVQGGIDMTAAYKGDNSHAENSNTNSNTTITKNYDYKMAYVDEKRR